MSTYTPKEAAVRSGFSIDTLRYYERVGVLPPVRRTLSGRRVFTDLDLTWLALLRCLRDTGMPIAETHQFVHLMRDERGTPNERLAVLVAPRGRVRQQMARLEQHLGQLETKIDTYRGDDVWSPRREPDEHRLASTLRATDDRSTDPTSPYGR